MFGQAEILLVNSNRGIAGAALLLMRGRPAFHQNLLASIVGIIEDFIIKDGIIEGETESDGVGGLKNYYNIY